MVRQSSAEARVAANPSSPLGLLDHANLNVPEWTEELDRFWFGILGCSRDPRDRRVIDTVKKSGGTMQDLVWVNMGLQQLHVPVGEPENALQRLPGVLGMTVPDLAALRRRLEEHSIEVQESEQSLATRRCGPGIEFRSPNEVLIRAHEAQTRFSFPEVLAAELRLPGVESLPSGVPYVELRCASGAAAGIARFYRQTLGVPAESSSGACLVPVGSQALLFREASEPLPEFDGHHVAVYVGDLATGDLAKTFAEMYERVNKQGLVYNNPRFPQLRYDSLEDALRHSEFRVLDLVDPETGLVVHRLEHEIRSLKHFTFHGKEVLADLQ